MAMETPVPDDDSSDSDDSDDSFFVYTLLGLETAGPSHITVRGAGNPAVNGVYTRDGYFERSIRYGKEGFWNNEPCKFSIFACVVSNGTKHWYISIVPYGRRPGTTADIDFYTTEFSTRVPPRTGWITTVEGMDPPPTVDI
jgi:ubiquitin carboxyl-terminal hydrolase 9/24